MYKPIEIVVGGTGPFDPAVNTTDCVIPLAAGMTIWIEKVGYGPYDYSKYTTLSLGGFRLTDTTFSAGERFFVHLVGVAYSYQTGSYSNGFNLALCLSKLFGRIGWKQESGVAAVNVTNGISKSGRYFNDGSFHATVLLQNLKAIMPDINPDATVFNAFLEQLQRSIIIRCLTGVFNPVEYISQNLLFNRYGSDQATIKNGNKFVGVRFRMPPADDLSLQIDQVSLYFDKTISFNLFVYSDLKKAPLAIIPVDVVADTQTVINLPDLVLTKVGSEFLGNALFIGYYQSDIEALGAKAIDEDDVCFTHNQVYQASFFEADITGVYQFNRANVSATNTTYGLNFNVSVFRDHTAQIILKPALFDNLIGLQMTAQFMEYAAFNTRSSLEQRRQLDQVGQLGLLMQLNGAAPISDSPHTTGIRQQIQQELDRLKESFFPKQKPHSIALC